MVTDGSRGIIRGRHYKTGQPIEVAVEQGKVAAISPLESSADQIAALMPDRGFDGELPLIGPGLFDLQLNGYRGFDFNGAQIAEGTTEYVTRALWKEGVTSYCPTVITNSNEAIESSMRIIGAACRGDSDIARCVAGIHLEGPFISPQDGARGAHASAHVKAPDWELLQRWQEAAEGRIRIITVSPEWPGSSAFISRCAESGIVVSIGHTAAAPEQIREAVEAGATMSTHFGNGAHPVLPRHPNYLWEQLASDDLWTCVIADGFHLPDSVLQVVRKVKGDKMLLVSDAVQLSGMAPGAYDMPVGGRAVLTEAGRLHLEADPRLLAGSAQMLLWGMAHMAARGLCSFADAWEMASVGPAAKLGHAAAADLAVGAAADLVLLDWDGSRAQVKATYKDGVQVYRG